MSSMVLRMREWFFDLLIVLLPVFLGNQLLKAPTEDGKLLINALDLGGASESSSGFDVLHPGGVIGTSGGTGLIGGVFTGAIWRGLWVIGGVAGTLGHYGNSFRPVRQFSFFGSPTGSGAGSGGDYRMVVPKKSNVRGGGLGQFFGGLRVGGGKGTHEGHPYRGGGSFRPHPQPGMDSRSGSGMADGGTGA